MAHGESVADAAHPPHEEEHDEHGGNRLYFVTWVWLLVLTVCEVTLVLVDVARPALVGGLLALTLLKVVLIVANFMHLRFEHVQLIYVTVVPLLMVAVMFFGMVGDFGSLLSR